SNRKLELTAKENGENEKVLEKLIKEFKELAETLNYPFLQIASETPREIIKQHQNINFLIYFLRHNAAGVEASPEGKMKKITAHLEEEIREKDYRHTLHLNPELERYD
ncbi:7360_t:CDS:2, partial [Gigaspora margarita]